MTAKWIGIALLVGIVAGVGCNLLMHDTQPVVSMLSPVSAVFLRLIKMIIAPLVLASLVSGVGKCGDSKQIGRIGLRTFGWFVAASFVSLLLGILLANILKPGIGMAVPLSETSQLGAGGSGSVNFDNFLKHLVPTSIVEAMAHNEILQIVLFGVILGIAAVAIGPSAKPVLELSESIMQLMLKVTSYVMMAAPFAVFASITAAIAEHGIGIIIKYGEFVGGFYASLVLLWGLLFYSGYLVIGKKVHNLLRQIKAPVILAYTTGSSEAAYPKTLEALERFGVPNRIAGFVLPLGYSFNLDGSMMYCAFAVIFISQAYGIDIPWQQQVQLLLLLMILSKGIAGVPRASLIVVAAALGMMHLPEAGLMLIFAVDQFLDMGRSATNVVGNSIAAAVVARWEEKSTAIQV